MKKIKILILNMLFKFEYNLIQPKFNYYFKMQDSITPYLHLLSSNNELTNENAAKFIIIQSTMNPQLVLQSTSDIFLLIQSLTLTDHPKWGAISSLVLALSNAINLQSNFFTTNQNPDQSAQFLITLIQISQNITQSYFSSKDESTIPPFLLPFSQALNRILSYRNNITRELLHAISDHCAVGFVPGTSFVPILIKFWDNILSVFQSLSANDFSHFSRPISSPDKGVVIFYLTLWASSMPELIQCREALNSLRDQNRRILELIEQDEIPFRSPAAYLLDCFKSFTIERSKLIQIGKENKQEWFKALTSYIKISINEKEEEPSSNSIKKTKTTSKIQRLFEIPADIMIKKKMKRFYLYFVPDAKIFAWCSNTDLKQAQYLHLTEIESATLDSLNQNVLTVTTFKKGNFEFMFNSTVYSQLFMEMLNSH